VERTGERVGSYRVLVGNPERMKPFGRSRQRLQDNIRIDHLKSGIAAWTGLTWLRIGTRDRLCECGDEPSGSTKCEKHS
jgi:hypothetical protein